MAGGPPRPAPAHPTTAFGRAEPQCTTGAEEQDEGRVAVKGGKDR